MSLLTKWVKYSTVKHNISERSMEYFLISGWFWRTVCLIHVSKLRHPHESQALWHEIYLCADLTSVLKEILQNTYEFFRHINEDKRKTEAQKQIFDVVYEVDGCPVSIVWWLSFSLLP